MVILNAYIYSKTSDKITSIIHVGINIPKTSIMHMTELMITYAKYVSYIPLVHKVQYI